MFALSYSKKIIQKADHVSFSRSISRLWLFFFFVHSKIQLDIIAKEFLFQ